MFDTSKLRGRIVEKFGTIGAFSKAAKSSLSFVSQYLNGKKFLDQRTLMRWAELLEIQNSEIDVYFFTEIVHETEQQAEG